MVIKFTIGNSFSRYYKVDFPLSDVYLNLKRMALEFLKGTPYKHEGLAWGEAFDRIPPPLWEKHGFYYPESISEDAHINVKAENYLIPPYAVRMIKITTYMVSYLEKHLDIISLSYAPVSLLNRINDFIFIWAPRFVDFDCLDADEFIENALADTGFGFWKDTKEHNAYSGNSAWF